MPKAWRVWESSASYYSAASFLNGKSSGFDSRVLTSESLPTAHPFRGCWIVEPCRQPGPWERSF